MLYEEMRFKKTGEVVRVYDITNGVATIFDPSLYQKQNNGWTMVKASQVVPMDFPLNSRDYISKTKRNKAKSRMQLLNATWRTTDGRLWNHSDITSAVKHELKLMESEKHIDETVGE